MLKYLQFPQGSLWRNGSFVLYWCGSAISILGSVITYVILPILVYRLTNNERITMKILEAYSRVFVDPDKFDDTIAFYEQLTQGRCRMRADYPEAHLQLADVVSPHATFLIIAGPPEARRPFETTPLTLKVDNLQATIQDLDALGAEHLDPMQPTPTGFKTRYRHPDGLIVEYVEHQEEKLKKLLVYPDEEN